MRKLLLELLLIITGIILSVATVAQGIDLTSTRKSSRAFLGISISPAKTSIINNFEKDNLKPEQKNKLGVSGSIEAGYMFSGFFGMSTGIGYSSYNTELYLSEYETAISAIDSDNDTYTRNIAGDNISETQKIAYITMPLLLDFVVPFGQKVGIEFLAGFNFNIALRKTYASDGTFGYSGYYPEYKVLFEDIPYEDFSSAVKNSVTGNLDIKPITTAMSGTASLFYKLNNELSLIAGMTFNKNLSNISGFPGSKEFILSEYPDELNSIMGATSEVIGQSIGINVGIRLTIL